MASAGPAPHPSSWPICSHPTLSSFGLVYRPSIQSSRPVQPSYSILSSA